MQIPLTVSVTCCGTTFVTSLGFLALASCHLWTDEAKIPLETNDEWLTHIIALIPVCIGYMIFSVFFLWTILAKERKIFFLSTLAMNMVLLGSAIYFTVVFDQELGVEDATPDDLFLKAKTDIWEELEKEGASSTFTPPWIDRIQRESKDCCGIKTYRDWQEFWPNAPNHIPASCCKDPTNTSTYCPTDLSKIPFPKTPIMFIKEDTGCVGEINTTAKKSIRECFIYGIIMCVVLGLAEIAYLVQYSLQYMSGNPFGDMSSWRLPWGLWKDPGGDDGNASGEQEDNLQLIGPQSSEFLDMGMGSQGTVTVGSSEMAGGPAFNVPFSDQNPYTPLSVPLNQQQQQYMQQYQYQNQNVNQQIHYNAAHPLQQQGLGRAQHLNAAQFYQQQPPAQFQPPQNAARFQQPLARVSNQSLDHYPPPLRQGSNGSQGQGLFGPSAGLPQLSATGLPQTIQSQGALEGPGSTQQILAPQSPGTASVDQLGGAQPDQFGSGPSSPTGVSSVDNVGDVLAEDIKPKGNERLKKFRRRR